MAVFPSDIQALMPWDNLQDFINDYTKGLQVLVDTIFDPDDDNQHERFIPHTYGSISFYARFQVRDLLTDAYSNNLMKDYGHQEWLIGGTLSIHGVTPTVTNIAVLGKMNQNNHWSNFTDAEKEYVDGLMNDWMAHDNKIYCVNEKSPTLVDLSSDYTDQYSVRYIVHPSGFAGDYLKFYFYSLITDDYVSLGNQKLWFYPETFMTETIDGYQYLKPVGRRPVDIYDIVSGTWDCYYGQPYVGKVKTATEAQNYVTRNGANHNYTKTYTDGDGDPFTVYYGDNYIIYVIDENDEVSYDDIYNVTVEVTPDIDPEIRVPTYTENKYGPEPPEPVTDDDYIDMGLGVETDGMAMYNMAVITRDDLIQLITDFEANADTGLSFIPHVLGLYKLGIESSQLLTTKSEQIKLHKEPNGTSAFTSVENYNIVKDQLQVIDCGSITVDRKELLTNTFYDYSPYSTYEMFIPGCGWITLPDTIVGRTISVSIVFDLTTCSCKGIVRSEGQLIGGSGTTLATVNGIIGSSVPLSINETGLQRAAIFNGSTQAAMALGTAFMGAGIGNPYMGASGVAMAAGALADNHVAGNTTYTNTKGGATDYSVFGDGYKAVLKITRPVVEIPDNYGHTVGFVVNEYGVLSDFHGFTVCINPHIHISATSDEKEEIKRLLESGVILPDGE